MKQLGYILFFLAIIYFIFLIRQDIIDNLELKREITRVSASLEQQGQLAEKLRTRLAELKTNKHIEELARTRLGLIKKDETAYKVIKN